MKFKKNLSYSFMSNPCETYLQIRDFAQPSLYIDIVQRNEKFVVECQSDGKFFLYAGIKSFSEALKIAYKNLKPSYRKFYTHAKN